MTELIKIASMRGNLSPELGYIDIRVDRASVLGNPFELTKEEDRDKVCDAYEEWFQFNLRKEHKENYYIDLSYWVNKGLKIAAKFKEPSCQQVTNEVNNHVDLLLEGKKVIYKCWCKKPKVKVRCHADSIKKEVLSRYNRLKDNTFYDYYTSDSYAGKYR